MKATFARHSIPEEVLGDNDPCYISTEFAQISKYWDFQHVTRSPRYPQSSGLVEITVQASKSIMQTCLESGECPHLGRLAYRTTQVGSGLSPAQLLMGRQLRSNHPITTSELAVPKSKSLAKWKKQNNKENLRNMTKKAVKVLKPLSWIQSQNLPYD